MGALSEAINRLENTSFLQRRQCLTATAAAVAAPWLTACSKPAPLLRVGTIVFPGYELMFLARELQFFDEHKLRLVELQANSNTMRAMATGQLEAAAMTLDEMMTARADGLDLRAVMVFDVSAGADVVLGKPGVTLSTLRGKRIGVEDGAMGAVMLGAVLQAAGIKVEDIRKVAMTLDRSVESYQSGRMDAIVTAEPWAGMLEQQGAQRIFDSTQIPDRIVDVLAVRADALELHAASIAELIKATFQARQFWLDKPAQAAVHMASRMQIPPDEVAHAFRGLLLPDVAANRRMLMPGGSLQRTVQELQRVMFAAGLLRKISDGQELLSSTFLPK